MRCMLLTAKSAPWTFAAAPSNRPLAYTQPQVYPCKPHAPSSTHEVLRGQILARAGGEFQAKADVSVHADAAAVVGDGSVTDQRLSGYKRTPSKQQADWSEQQPQPHNLKNPFHSLKKQLDRSANEHRRDHHEQYQKQRHRLRQHTQVSKKYQTHEARTQFSNCTSYQELYNRLQQQERGQSDINSQQQQQQQWQPLLTAADCVNLIAQISTIRNQACSRRSNEAAGSNNDFVEDQALLQILPLAYDILDRHVYGNSPQLTPTAAAATAKGSQTSLGPVELLHCISILASLQYSQPSRLAALLSLPAAGRQGLSRLRMHQLSALVAGLAKSGVRPSNGWLAALMQAVEAKLQTANLAQLSELLHGLVKMGVKPAASWLDNLQEQAISCLIEQAVRCQIVSDHTQHKQQQPLQASDMGPTAAAEVTPQNPSMSPASSRSAPPRSSRRRVECQLHDIAQLLTAFAEARHSPKPQLSAALWGATASSLDVADSWALVKLLSALGELGLVPPRSWIEHYYSRTATLLQQQGQYRPWQLSESIQAVGRLVQAGMDCCLASTTQQRALHDDMQGGSTHSSNANSACLDCLAWVSAVLSSAEQQLVSLSARELAVLLSGLAALQLPLAPKQLSPFFAEVQHKLPRLNTAGLATLAEAAAQLNEQRLVSDSGVMQAAGQQSSAQALSTELPVQLTEGWNKALLHETLVKLPMFSADDLARLVIAVSGTKTCRASDSWLEAATAHLHSKLTTLGPHQLVQLLAALVAIGYVPEQRWLRSLLTVIESRAIEVNSRDMLQLLELVVALQVDLTVECVATLQWAVQQQLMQNLDYKVDGCAECASKTEEQKVLERCTHLLKQMSTTSYSRSIDITADDRQALQ